MNTLHPQPARTRFACRPARWNLLLILVFSGLLLCARAEIQFDAFPGFDGVVPDASWVPIACEVRNDTAPFTGLIRVESAIASQGQIQELPIELPTGTLKRVVIPIFSGGRNYKLWDVTLIDSRGRLRAERRGLAPRRELEGGIPLLGAISRNPVAGPVLHPVLSKLLTVQPQAVELPIAIFPDQPLVLEGLSALYLNSARVHELTPSQARAIDSWIRAGGHLILAVESVSDLSAAPWLKKFCSCEFLDFSSVRSHPELHSWLTQATWPTNRLSFSGPTPQSGKSVKLKEMNEAQPFPDLAVDSQFEQAPLEIISVTLKGAATIIAADSKPLIIRSEAGTGRVTTLLFNPEREPFRSWKHRPLFWSLLLGVPGEAFLFPASSGPGAVSTDGVFGGIVDSRQVHKIPLGWLFCLLVLYLGVIGPFDRYLVRRLGRPMLTWITFPGYVVLFSGLIYFIGHKLRAGESEWNEIHLVDCLPKGPEGNLRGRTYLSAYSPENRTFDLQSSERNAVFRSEFSFYGGGAGAARNLIVQAGNRFKARIFVPVWTSKLFACDWWSEGPEPVNATVRRQDSGWRLYVTNNLAIPVRIKVALGDRLMELPEMKAKEALEIPFTPARSVREFVDQNSAQFHTVAYSRGRAFGKTDAGYVSSPADAAVALSLLNCRSGSPNARQRFLEPPGLDLSHVLERGQALLFVWAENTSPTAPLGSFVPRRSHRFTLWRMPLDLSEAATPRSPLAGSGLATTNGAGTATSPLSRLGSPLLTAGEIANSP